MFRSRLLIVSRFRHLGPRAAEDAAGNKAREEVLAATLAPYDGPSEHGVDTSTLRLVMCATRDGSTG